MNPCCEPGNMWDPKINKVQSAFHSSLGLTQLTIMHGQAAGQVPWGTDSEMDGDWQEDIYWNEPLWWDESSRIRLRAKLECDTVSPKASAHPPGALELQVWWGVWWTCGVVPTWDSRAGLLYPCGASVRCDPGQVAFCSWELTAGTSRSEYLCPGQVNPGLAGTVQEKAT